MLPHSLSIRGVEDNEKDVILVYDQTGFFFFLPIFDLYSELGSLQKFSFRKKKGTKTSICPLLLFKFG